MLRIAAPRKSRHSGSMLPLLKSSQVVPIIEPHAGEQAKLSTALIGVGITNQPQHGNGEGQYMYISACICAASCQWAGVVGQQRKMSVSERAPWCGG